MVSTRAGLRKGDLEKDNYGRLICAECGVGLQKRNAEDGIGAVRTCPECGREWEQLP